MGALERRGKGIVIGEEGKGGKVTIDDSSSGANAGCHEGVAHEKGEALTERDGVQVGYEGEDVGVGAEAEDAYDDASVEAVFPSAKSQIRLFVVRRSKADYVWAYGVEGCVKIAKVLRVSFV